MDFENTGLWSRALGERSGDAFATQRERLRSAYRQFWYNAVALANQIQKDVPGLTLHDETHFNALWARADQIAGANIELSPLEAFILGGAILIHDAANTVAAFSGGLDEVKQTSEWKDAEAEWLDKNTKNTGDMAADSAAEAHILFEALRALHAQRAETLSSLQVVVNGNTFWLIQDDQLRTHLGGMIGLIGASHHWDVAKLPVRLRQIVGALDGFPSDWTIRPILLACLLRCADAVQIDQVRTPDFLYGILKLKGISELHWRAQNRLSKPLLDPQDPQALLFTSTLPFDIGDADAWWIAYDALQVANRELQSADALLRDLRLPAFAVTRISHSESPDRLSKQLVTNGWEPVAAEVRINQVAKVVDMFGGEQLYGRDGQVPLRELIQNAIDAIGFRKALEHESSGFAGRISVKLSEGEHEGGKGWWLQIEDNGLGMSEAVLTGPLIDFGSSYITSPLVKMERPGLIAARSRRIGKYGIGFFSSFMLSDDVDVTSRPFDKALEDCRTLRFRDGLALRPLLLASKPIDFDATLSTRVSLFLTGEKKAELLTFQTSSFSQKEAPISLDEAIKSLCPMLEIDVWTDENGVKNLSHSSDWAAKDRRAWLEDILIIAKRQNNDVLKQAVETCAPIMDYIDAENPASGLAAISFTGGGGLVTVGGLYSQPGFNRYSDDFIGVMDFNPEGPRRWNGQAVAAHKLSTWATKQAAQLSKLDLNVARKNIIAIRVAKYGGDATPILQMKIDRIPVDMEQIFERLSQGESCYSPVKSDMTGSGKILVTTLRTQHSGFVDNYRTEELEFLMSTLEPLSDGDENLFEVPVTGHEASHGFCTLLEKYSAYRGYRMNGEFFPKTDFAKYIGKSSERDGIVTGKIISTDALKISLSKI